MHTDSNRLQGAFAPAYTTSFHGHPLNSIIISTAGHIDHGKSSLIQALTNTDPDRLQEEKERGITLDLGFAHLQEGDQELYFVDVPGHEGLIHNMLAGAGGMDFLMLVVAADSGIMPQTLEHFHIARLLGIQQGMVLLTRADLADAEMIELVTLEILELVEGSFLESAPILPCSSITGEGIAEIKEHLFAACKANHLAQQGTPFRLPVDRSFHIKGHGTVVTGTVTQGAYTENDPLTLFPREEEVKVRGLQTHGKAATKASKGERAAFNLQNVKKEEIHRGDQLAQKSSLQVLRQMDVQVEWLQGGNPQKKKISVMLYSNAQSSLAEVSLISAEQGFYHIRLEKPLAFQFQDRLILRTPNLQQTLGGGVVLSLQGSRDRKLRPLLPNLLSQIQSEKGEASLEALLMLQGLQGCPLAEIYARLRLPLSQAKKRFAQLVSSQKAVLLLEENKKYIHPFHLQRLINFLQSSLSYFHSKHPELSGAKAEYFAGKLKQQLSAKEVASLLKWAEKQNYISKVDHFYHLADFNGALSKKQIAAKKALLEHLTQEGCKLYSVLGLAEALQIPETEVTDLLKLGIQQGWLLRVKENLCQTPENLKKLIQGLIHYLQEHESITVIEFKEHFGLARKESIALLEYLDHRKITLRIEDTRVLRENERKL